LERTRRALALTEKAKVSNVIVVIPTYWTWDSERADGPVEAVYDHPTPLDGESTLPRP